MTVRTIIARLGVSLVSPLGAGLASLVLVFVTLLLGHTIVAMTLLLATTCGLGLASAPLFAAWILRTLESQYPPVAAQDAPTADVAIILGGFALPSMPPRDTAPPGEPVDRATHAARLLRAGRVKHLLACGGNQRWNMDGEPEAVLVARYLVDLSVPPDLITTETTSSNTRENAVNAAALISTHAWSSALLVTSAFHMPRALAVFRKAGIKAVPAATDARARSQPFNNALDLLPDVRALDNTTDAVKEWIGILVYRLRGWA